MCTISPSLLTKKDATGERDVCPTANPIGGPVKVDGTQLFSMDIH